ncbi:MAG: hypothetical protein WCS03_01015 [Bacteroidota bacterium]
MRIFLIIAVLLLAGSANLSAQYDFKVLDEKTYDYYMKGDYRNLKKVADTMLSQGVDYYYLRMRMGILSYNKQLYSSALKHFNKAIEFSSPDTISREYIYYSYLYSGREADAKLYLKSIPRDKKNSTLKSSCKPSYSEFYVGSYASVHDAVLYEKNSLNYEAVKNSLSINAGFETYFLSRFKGTFAYTNFHKTGTVYSPSHPAGTDLNFTQNQVYAKLTGSIFPGWDFSGFAHFVLYTEAITVGPVGNRVTTNQIKTEYLGGVGISKNGWKIRTGANLSFSNFSNSNQIRGEGYFTWLPSGNLNLYLASAWLGQIDTNWGGTYQVSQEIGLKICKLLWMETGVVKGNSFLSARNQGFMINNSFQIPATTIYSNIIILPGKHFRLDITPYYVENQIYSWDLNAFSRTNKLNINSFGGSLKLIYKYK